MLPLIVVRRQLQDFVSYVNDNFSGHYTIIERDGWITIDTGTHFVTCNELGCLPARLLAYCNIDSCHGEVRLMFEKADFRS